MIASTLQMDETELAMNADSSLRELNRMVVINKVWRIDSLIIKVYKSVHQHNRSHHKLLCHLNDMSIRTHNLFRLYIN